MCQEYSENRISWVQSLSGVRCSFCVSYGSTRMRMDTERSGCRCVGGLIEPEWNSFAYSSEWDPLTAHKHWYSEASGVNPIHRSPSITPVWPLYLSTTSRSIRIPGRTTCERQMTRKGQLHQVHELFPDCVPSLDEAEILLPSTLPPAHPDRKGFSWLFLLLTPCGQSIALEIVSTNSQSHPSSSLVDIGPFRVRRVYIKQKYHTTGMYCKLCKVPLHILSFFSSCPFTIG